MNATAGTAVKRRRKLHGLSDVRRYFHRNEIPVYFISATNFNLLGMDEWVKNFKFIRDFVHCLLQSVCFDYYRELELHFFSF